MVFALDTLITITFIMLFVITIMKVVFSEDFRKNYCLVVPPILGICCAICFLALNIAQSECSCNVPTIIDNSPHLPDYHVYYIHHANCVRISDCYCDTGNGLICGIYQSFYNQQVNNLLIPDFWLFIAAFVVFFIYMNRNVIYDEGYCFRKGEKVEHVKEMETRR